MEKLIILVVLLQLSLSSLIFCAPYSADTSETIIVDIKDQGLVKGNYDTTAWTEQRYMQFRGIPYASSPTGPLRFKEPVERQPWNGYVDATNWGRRCPVYTTVDKLNADELNDDLEDCLNLSVYTKNLTAKAPVMVYVHGGGFYNGTAIDHPPQYLMEKDIVLVVLQYRIGILGFMSTRTTEIPGNAAIADVLFALKWIKKNIGVFGGDAERLTIFGQSAGAMIIGALMLSPKTPTNLFQRTIMQSGSITNKWLNFDDPTNPIEQSKRICKALGCAEEEEQAEAGGCEKIELINACLMSANVSSILKVTKNEDISPIVGDMLGILPQQPYDLFKKYDKSIEVMTGFTKHDGSYVLGVYYDRVKKAFGDYPFTVKQFISGAFDLMKDPTGFSASLQRRLFFTRDILDNNDHSKALPGYFDLFNVFAFKSPALTFISHLFKTNPARIYLYTFDYDEGEHTRFGYEMGNEHYPFNGGVHHSDDNIYIFATHPLNEKDTKMSQKMIDYWTSFAINGKPESSSDGDAAIPSMESESGPYFHINEKTTIGHDAFDEFTVTINDPENYKLIRAKVEFL